MKKPLIFAVSVFLTLAAGTSIAAPDFKAVVTDVPLGVKAGRLKESVDLLLQLDGLVGLSILEKKHLARVLEDVHNELTRREEHGWLYKADEHARKLFPSERGSGANFGEACMARADFKLAAKVLAEAAGQKNSYYPVKGRDPARADLLLARASLVVGNVKQAQQAIARALEISPTDARLHYTKAQVMMRAQDWAQVDESLRTAFRINPKLAQPVDYLVQASCAQRKQQYDMARKVLEEALSRYPAAPGLHYSLGQTFQAMKKPARAFYQFQYEIMLSGPRSSYTDDATDQIEIMTALIDREKDPANYLKVAYGASALARMNPEGYEKAVEYIEKGLRANGDDCLPLQMLLGNAYVGLEKYDLAAKAFASALRVDPFFVPAYVDLGDTYKKLGKEEKALEQYAKALTLDKHNWRVLDMLRKIDKAREGRAPRKE